MSNDETLEQLRDMLLEEVASDPTEVEEFMSAPADSAPGTLERMCKQFVEKVLKKFHPEPVKDVENDMTLGQWIKATREKARLTQSFVATALGETPSFVERLEKGDILPCTIPAAKGAEIATLFQIHFSAFSILTANSYKAIEPSLNPSSKSNMSSLSPESSHLSPDEERSGMVRNWISTVKGVIEKNQAAYLLD